MREGVSRGPVSDFHESGQTVVAVHALNEIDGDRPLDANSGDIERPLALPPQDRKGRETEILGWRRLIVALRERRFGKTDDRNLPAERIVKARAKAGPAFAVQPDMPVDYDG